jgi:DNA transformation protein
MSSGYGTYLLDELGSLGQVSLRRMFGGQGLFLDGLMIGIMAEDVLYLKVDAHNRPDFEAAGSEPFVYERMGREVALSFWRLPDEIIEDGEELRAWALKSRAAAITTGQAKPLRPKAAAKKKAAPAAKKPIRRKRR